MARAAATAPPQVTDGFAPRHLGPRPADLPGMPTWRKINPADRPVIILAAPRSGSTLLFETLSEAPEFWTVGGESHQFIEGLKPLHPVAGRIHSNRLTERHATPARGVQVGHQRQGRGQESATADALSRMRSAMLANVVTSHAFFGQSLDVRYTTHPPISTCRIRMCGLPLDTGSGLCPAISPERCS